ncbi:acetyltransferase [Altibacter sp. HG106]|uniref:acetyltransferase n=1 Tax=Altibacter sp. HG106 TaxID=3023937 RepID=UPI00235044C6|nr:acetyltransferase [Altibacter sp. HG106]MDC7995355.1 acetyltransferase [Altibacter sp. HG106]
MKTIHLYGGGGHCYAAIELIRSLGEYEPSCVYDDHPTKKMILDIPVSKRDNATVAKGAACVTIGNNVIRKKLVNQLSGPFPSFVHASAVVYPSVFIGEGTLVHPLAVLDAAVSVGAFCIINNHATVSHNVRIGDFSHIAIQAAVAGGVTIGSGTLVGAGSVILPELNIGNNVVIGAGAVVTKDIPDDVTVYGNPAKMIKNNLT